VRTVDDLVDAMALTLNEHNVTPRMLNIAGFTQGPTMPRGMPPRPIPFKCDDCHLLPALYGDPVNPGTTLRCPGCHVKSLVQVV
jgi:hypothetical protein